MTRTVEMAMTTQALWRVAKLAETGKNERRSYTSPPSDLQKWRLEIIREISKHIWAMGLGEFWIRDLTTRLTSCFTRNANRRIIFRTYFRRYGPKMFDAEGIADTSLWCGPECGSCSTRNRHHRKRIRGLS